MRAHVGWALIGAGLIITGIAAAAAPWPSGTSSNAVASPAEARPLPGDADNDAAAVNADEVVEPGEPDARLRGPIEPDHWPQYITIDSVAIDASVLPVALESDGVMAVPPDGADVGWYKRGAEPGAPGMAVLTAHVDTRRDGPGAFFRLRDVTAGDHIELTLADGTVQHWEVTHATQQPKAALPVANLYVRDGDPQLALVTCAGAFDRTERRYRDNLIVYAVPARPM